MILQSCSQFAEGHSYVSLKFLTLVPPSLSPLPFLAEITPVALRAPQEVCTGGSWDASTNPAVKGKMRGE